MPPEKLQEILVEHRKWLRGEGGSRADLRGAVLRGADLRGAVLRGADLCSADLRGAVLRGADLRGADLRGADLCSAVLRGADLRGADLSSADLSGAVLRGGKFMARAAVQFSAHGECGRELSAILTDAKKNPVTLWCGCFTGTPEELREYIAKGDEKYKPSRTLALDTVLMLLGQTKGDEL